MAKKEITKIINIIIFAGARAQPDQIQPVDSLVKINTDQLVQGAGALSLSQQNRNPSEQNIDFSWNRLVLHAIWSYKEQSYKEPALRFWKKIKNQP